MNAVWRYIYPQFSFIFHALLLVLQIKSKIFKYELIHKNIPMWSMHLFCFSNLKCPGWIWCDKRCRVWKMSRVEWVRGMSNGHSPTPTHWVLELCIFFSLQATVHHLLNLLQSSLVDLDTLPLFRQLWRSCECN